MTQKGMVASTPIPLTWQRGGEVGSGNELPGELAQLREGLLETIAIRQGRPLWLHRHCLRLREALHTCYGRALTPFRIHQRLRAAWRGRDGRLRCLADPRGEITLIFQPEQPLLTPLQVCLLEVKQPLGAFKTLDRRRHDSLRQRASAAEGEEALLFQEGELLEGTYTNVFLHDRHGWHTPPADGRILPGIAREVILLHLRRSGIAVAERPFPVAALSDCDRIVLCNALRGIIPVRRVILPDGTVLFGAQPD